MQCQGGDLTPQIAVFRWPPTTLIELLGNPNGQHVDQHTEPGEREDGKIPEDHEKQGNHEEHVSHFLIFLMALRGTITKSVALTLTVAKLPSTFTIFPRMVTVSPCLTASSPSPSLLRPGPRVVYNRQSTKVLRICGLQHDTIRATTLLPALAPFDRGRRGRLRCDVQCSLEYVSHLNSSLDVHHHHRKINTARVEVAPHSAPHHSRHGAARLPISR